MVIRILTLVSITALCFFASFSGHGETEITLKNNHKNMGTLSLKTGEGIKFKRASVNLYNPITKRESHYEGYWLDDILNYINKGWRKSGKRIVVEALDRYRSILKVSHIIELEKNYRGFVAVAEKNGSPFLPYVKGGKAISLGPAFLVWTGVHKNNYRKHKQTHKWPYQIKTIQLLE